MGQVVRTWLRVAPGMVYSPVSCTSACGLKLGQPLKSWPLVRLMYAWK